MAKAQVRWGKPSKDDDGTYDLIGRYKGKDVDIIGRCDDTWSVMYDLVRLVEGLPTREAAKEWAETHDLVEEVITKARGW